MLKRYCQIATAVPSERDAAKEIKGLNKDDPSSSVVTKLSTPVKVEEDQNGCGRGDGKCSTSEEREALTHIHKRLSNSSQKPEESRVDVDLIISDVYESCILKNDCFLAQIIETFETLTVKSNRQGSDLLFSFITKLPEKEQHKVYSVLYEEYYGRESLSCFWLCFRNHFENKLGERNSSFNPDSLIQLATFLGQLLQSGAFHILPFIEEHISQLNSREEIATILDEDNSVDGQLKHIVIEILLNRNIGSSDGRDLDLDLALHLLQCHQKCCDYSSLYDSNIFSIPYPGCYMRLRSLTVLFEKFEEHHLSSKYAHKEEVGTILKHLLSMIVLKIQNMLPEISSLKRHGLCPLNNTTKNLQCILGISLRLICEYWKLLDTLQPHCKVIREHQSWYVKASEDDIANVLDADESELNFLNHDESKWLVQHDIESKIIALMLWKTCLEYLSVGNAKLEMKDIIDNNLLSCLCKSSSMLAQWGEMGRTSWLAYNAYFKSKPTSCIAIGLSMMLHFELIRNPSDTVITCILSALETIKPFVLREVKCEKDAALYSFQLLSTDAYNIINQILMLSISISLQNAPTTSKDIQKCIFSYLNYDVRMYVADLSQRSMQSFFKASAEFRSNLIDIVGNFYRVYFYLRIKESKMRLCRKRNSKMVKEEDAFFTIMNAILCLLIDATDSKEISRLCAVGDESNITEGFLDLLYLSMSGLDVIAPFVEKWKVKMGSDVIGESLKCNLETMTLFYDFALYRVVAAMKRYHSKGKVNREMSRQVYEGFKEFAKKCIETFSLSAPPKMKADTKSSKEENRTPNKPQNGRKGKMKRSNNAFIDAAIQGEGYQHNMDGDLSDLEDFIVCKPGRNYVKVLAKRSPKAGLSVSSDRVKNGSSKSKSSKELLRERLPIKKLKMDMAPAETQLLSSQTTSEDPIEISSDSDS